MKVARHFQSKVQTCEISDRQIDLQPLIRSVARISGLWVFLPMAPSCQVMQMPFSENMNLPAQSAVQGPVMPRARSVDQHQSPFTGN